ncbi:hypothetical protein G6O43_26055, partial [Salmonella enterica subsp. enterica serovar 4:-:1,2]|nr:hypothetical protein [Salmonella enterica subsp. enterica serovar 4:-:1,2]
WRQSRTPASGPARDRRNELDPLGLENAQHRPAQHVLRRAQADDEIGRHPH